MPAERLSMRKLREVLRLRYEAKLSARAIGRSCRISSSTVLKYLGRAKVAKLSWPLPSELDDEALERLLFPDLYKPIVRRPEIDFMWVHTELKKRHVTKMLLWQEYREQHPDGYQYSQFCERYMRWLSTLSVTMRQHHRAGEKLFIDFSGDGIDITDPLTGEVKTAKLFIAVLGASNYTYVEPVLSEDIATWISCHVRAFTFFGGVPEILVPDNLKCGVTKASFYDPVINRTYADLAEHYNTAVIPARKRKPRDKAKAENGVLVAERWIIAALRNRDFTSLEEVREAAAPLAKKLNERPMQKIKKSRRQMFEELEKTALKPLPQQKYELCVWKKASVNIDYHIEFDDHYYSVHYTYYTSNRRKVEVRATATTIEIFWASKRIASHIRKYKKYDHTTNPEHMPPAHRQNLEWPPSRIINWAKSVGLSTAQVVEEIMSRKKHPEQGYRSCLGIMRLRNRYPDERIEKACARALKYQTISGRSIRTILKNNRDRLDDDDSKPEQQSLPWHSNIRGANYYH